MHWYKSYFFWTWKKASPPTQTFLSWQGSLLCIVVEFRCMRVCNQRGHSVFFHEVILPPERENVLPISYPNCYLDLPSYFVLCNFVPLDTTKHYSKKWICDKQLYFTPARKRSRARVTIGRQCVLLPNFLKIQMLIFFRAKITVWITSFQSYFWTPQKN